MRKLGLFLFGIATFLCFHVQQTNLLAESQYRGIKAGVGVAVTAGALASWWHYGNELKNLEKVQKTIEKMKVIDTTHVPRLKRLMRYKYISFFVALLGMGYTVKQMVSLIDDDRKNNLKKEVAEDNFDASKVFYYLDENDVDVADLKAFLYIDDKRISYMLSASPEIASQIIRIASFETKMALSYPDVIRIMKESRQNINEGSGRVSRSEALKVFNENLYEKLKKIDAI